MKQDFVKGWRWGHWHMDLGIALYDWALPLHLAWETKDYRPGIRWVCISVLCFYLSGEWCLQPDLADQMLKTLKEN